MRRKHFRVYRGPPCQLRAAGSHIGRISRVKRQQDEAWYSLEKLRAQLPGTGIPPALDAGLAEIAAKASGREASVTFIGIDGLPHEGQMYVKQGILSASFEYPTGGREAIETALSILSGRQVPKEITLKSRVFTRDNIDKGGALLEE